MDLGAVIGVFFGIVCILIGQALEGGNIGQLIQITAAFIVFGGTAGAVIMSFPVPTMKDAMLVVSDIFAGPKVNFDETIDEIIQYAQKARKEGVISLEKDAKNVKEKYNISGDSKDKAAYVDFDIMTVGGKEYGARAGISAGARP